MKLKTTIFSLMAMLAVVFGAQEPLSAAKHHKHSTESSDHCSSESSDHCSSCHKVEEQIEGIARIVQQDLIIDTNTNFVVQQINQTTQNDFAVDQEILAIVTDISDELACSAVIPITPADFMDGQGNLSQTYVISESGKYQLCVDIAFDPQAPDTQAILIEADNVSLNLNGNILSQVDQSVAGVNGVVVDPGLTNIKIYNGTISGFSNDAILAGDPTLTNQSIINDLKIWDITSIDNAYDAIQVLSATNLFVSEVDGLGNASGERVLEIDTCKNVIVNKVTATGYTSTIGSIIEINFSSVILVQNVDVSNNTKTVTTSNFKKQQFSIVSIYTCQNVEFVRVTMNNNTNTTAVAANFTVFGVYSSPNCTIRSSHINNNTDTAGGLSTFDDIMYVLSSNNFAATDCQVNNNSCTTTVRELIGIYISGSDVVTLDGVQANFNSVVGLAVRTSGSSDLHGIYVTSSSSSGTAYLRNCQTSFNTVGTGGAGRGLSNFAYLAGLHMDVGQYTIENHQSDWNSMGDNQPNTEVEGIEMGGNSLGGTMLINSSACNNTGGVEAYGITLDETSVTVSFNKTVINCIACNNGNYGINMNFPDDLTDPGANIIIRDCICGDNGLPRFSPTPGFGPSAGINLRRLSPGLTNVVIKGCQVFGTSSTDTTNGNATGILVQNATNVVIEDTDVFNTIPATTSLTGHGILFDTCKGCKVIRSQVHGNQNSGIEIVGTYSNIAIIESIALENGIGVDFALGSTASCCLVQDSRALSNTTAGFKYAASPTPFTVTFIGNEAQCNGTVPSTDNYSLGANNIPLQTLSWSTGVRANVGATTDALGSRFTNMYMVP